MVDAGPLSAARSARDAGKSPRPEGAPTVKAVDAIAQILKIEGAEFLSAYLTTPLIEAAARAGIRPVLCGQERVNPHCHGVGR